MIKAIAGDTLLIILSERNLELLKEKRSIHIEFSEKDTPIKKIVIGYVRTEEEAMEKLLPLIISESKIHGREN